MCALQFTCKLTIVRAILPDIWESEGFRQQKWPSVSLKVIAIDAFQQATYDFLLGFHHNYVSILHHFRDIVSNFPKYKEVMKP